MKEIVTVQVGDFANFIGSHFWNFQDELLGLAEDPCGDAVYKNQSLDMDVFYRAGETQQIFKRAYDYYLQDGSSSCLFCSCKEGLENGFHLLSGIWWFATNSWAYLLTPLAWFQLIFKSLAGSLGSLSSYGSLYKETSSIPSHVSTWSGNVSKHVSEPHKKNLFLQRLYEEQQEKSTVLMNDINKQKDDCQSQIQDKDIVECLESDVQYWTDFSKVHYHPQSLYELNGLWMDIQEFDNYGIGRDIFSRGSRGDEMNDRLRFFVEECDHIQGIQYIVDDSGGFSSVAADFLENVADEYRNTPVMIYTTRSPSSYMKTLSRKHVVSRALHDAISFSRLSSLCKLIVPVGLPLPSRSKLSDFLRIQDEKPYHCSAVYAAALHSTSLPFRMEPLGPMAEAEYFLGALDINGVVQMLAGQARQNIVATLDVAMPVPALSGSWSEQTFLENLHSLTPEISEDVEDLQAVESTSVHGVLHSGGLPASVSEVKESVHNAYQRAVAPPMFSHISVARCPLPIPLPFPSIFRNHVGQHGELWSSPAPGTSSRGSLDVHSMPMAARLRSSSAVLPFVENRLQNLRRFGINRGAPGAELLQSWGFEKDELEDMGEGLEKMVMALTPRPHVSSDSD